jgi:molecular chaperone HtpG
MGQMPDQYTVMINANHSLTRKLATTLEHPETKEKAKQLFDLALLGQGLLKGKALTDFLDRSVAGL